MNTPVEKLPVGYPYDYGVEQTILANCLANPPLIGELAAKIVPEDFQGPLNKRIFTVLVGLSNEGRKPSVEAVLGVIGEEEVAPNLTTRDYLRNIIETRIYSLGGLPIEDAVETLLDSAQRRNLSLVGGELSMGATSGAKSVADLGTGAVAKIDEVLASLRAKRRKAYQAGAAGEAALKLLTSDAKPSITTGLIDLDKMLGGWPRGQLSVIAGRPGTGKSAAATGCVLSAARAGHPVVFFSLEMHDEQLGARMLSDLAYRSDLPPLHYETVLKRQTIDERQLSRLGAAQIALEKLSPLINIEEQRGLTVAEIAARTRKYAGLCERAGKPLEMVVVDHLHIVQSSGRWRENRVRELAEISDGLATLAKELGIAMVALCQLNRGVEGRENKRPTMPDLRESGSLEEDASVIIFLYRAAYYLEKQRFDDEDDERARVEMLNQVRNKIEFGIDKNRNGRVGIIDAFVDIGANAIRNGTFNQ